MRLVSDEAEGQQRFGVAQGAHVIDLTGRLPHYRSLRELIAGNAMAQARSVAETAEGHGVFDNRLDALTLLPPVLRPEKIWCIGANYAERKAEYRDQTEQPRYPSLFARSPGSFVGHDAALVRPRQSEQLDYEDEIVLVTGRQAPG